MWTQKTIVEIPSIPSLRRRMFTFIYKDFLKMDFIIIKKYLETNDNENQRPRSYGMQQKQF